MSWDDLDSERVLQIMRQISGEDIEESITPIPQYRIKGKGIAYYWNPTTKSFIKIHKGTSVYIVSYKMDEKGRILVFNSNKMFAISYKELEKIGFN